MAKEPNLMGENESEEKVLTGEELEKTSDEQLTKVVEEIAKYVTVRKR